MTNAPVSHTVLALICIAGCGGNPESPAGTYIAPSTANQPEFAAIAAAQTISEEQPPGAAAQAGKTPIAAEPGKLQRQIIYDADVRLIVEDFEGIPERVQRLVTDAGGFVAQHKLHGRSGNPRSGEWKIRIPAAGYANFLDEVRNLGELLSLAANSQDVTEQYYDLEARIRNKRKEEARLLKHLDENTGKLEEILAVEKEISRVREELERMEGRMRVLKDLVSLTTVTLHVDEIKGYVPPQAPTFALRVSRAFAGSWEALVATGEGLVVAGAAVGPWLAVIGAPAFALVLFVRRRRRLA
jgi:hypothetical protein